MLTVPGSMLLGESFCTKSIAWMAASHNVDQLFYFKQLRFDNF